MENKDLLNNNLEKLKKKIIKTGFAGIFLFATSVVGAVASFYISSFPEYAKYKTDILTMSAIDFVLGVGILIVFRNLIISYKTKISHNNQNLKQE